MIVTDDKKDSEDKKKNGDPFWLIYGAAFLAGIVLLANALDIFVLQKTSGRLAIGLIYSAFALMFAKGKPAGTIATVLIWAAIVVSFLVA